MPARKSTSKAPAKTAKSDTKVEPMALQQAGAQADETPKTQRADARAPEGDAETDQALEAATLESPISTTGASPVFRTDLGEALPPQKPAGVE